MYAIRNGVTQHELDVKEKARHILKLITCAVIERSVENSDWGASEFMQREHEWVIERLQLI